jgi:hypothetical protein
MHYSFTLKWEPEPFPTGEGDIMAKEPRDFQEKKGFFLA